MVWRIVPGFIDGNAAAVHVKDTAGGRRFGGRLAVCRFVGARRVDFLRLEFVLDATSGRRGLGFSRMRGLVPLLPDLQGRCRTTYGRELMRGTPPCFLGKIFNSAIWISLDRAAGDRQADGECVSR
jgi:hypothetical protein